MTIINPDGVPGLFDDANMIDVYTREQAIADGVLVPTTQLVPDEDMAQEAGLRLPVALTRRLADLVTPTDAEQGRCQDLKGRLWDVLWMCRLAVRRSAYQGKDTVLFGCIFDISGRDDYRTASGRRITGRRELTLKAVVHGGDHGESVVTISFPNED